MLRIAFAGALCCALPSVVIAEPNLPAGITCETIKAKVAEFGRLRALLWARRQGYPIAQINEARKCLAK